MKLVATMPVRNEDWCLDLTLRAVLTWCDAVVVGLHACTDLSTEIARAVELEHPGRVILTTEPDPVWHEASHRQRLLDTARSIGATHIALVDADEILTANLVPVIRALIREGPAGSILQLPWVCLARSLDRRYVSGPWYNNWVTTAFCDSPQSCWIAPGGYDLHHRHPHGRPPIFDRPISQETGGLMHLQFLSERRLRAKQAAYLVTEALRWEGRQSIESLNAMYGRAVYESNPDICTLSDVPPEWWANRAAAERLMDRNDEQPWQERMVLDAVAEHGRDRFKRYDLFGVA